MVTDSQCKLIRNVLKGGNTITSSQAKTWFGCERLASRINNLKNQGMDIQKNMIPVKNRYGKTVRIAEYYLNNKESSCTA